MTTPRYILERIAQAFGYNRRTRRLSDAAAEMHLLREAEAHLGGAIWKNVEAIETLSSEYWNLRKLSKKHQELEARINECRQQLQQTEDERAAQINQHAGTGSSQLEQKRSLLIKDLEGLAKKREAISEEGRRIRRLFNGEKTKLEVISNEHGSSEQDIAPIQTRLDELKGRFTELKHQRDEISALISQGDKELDALNKELLIEEEKGEQVASEAFSTINQINKQIWQLRSESGVLESRMHQLHAEIGRHISRNAFHDAACKQAAASQQGLIDVMRALRRSIALNHRLADRH